MNRKKLLLANSAVVIASSAASILLALFEVKFFLGRFGSTVNGLMQTGNQVLAYLSLIEAGIGASFLYNLYKPIAAGDDAGVAAIYRGFKKSIGSIVLKMLACAVVLSFVYPIFLRRSGLDYFYMVSIFLLLGCKSILPYFLSYVPKYMIIAKEQRYKSELITGLTKVLTYSVEILLVRFTVLPLQLILLVCILVSVLSGLAFRAQMLRIYPQLRGNRAKPDLSPTSMSRDVLVHNLSGLAFNSTDNILISTLRSLESVTVYSNYNHIVSQCMSLFQSIFDGATASLGIKAAKKDDNLYSVYRQLLSGCLFLGCVVSAVFAVMANAFITVWVGEAYLTSVLNCYLFALILYSGIVYPCICTVRNAYGLYKESRSFTIAQTVMNIVLTVALTPFFGITGALTGTLAARVFITIPCNYFLVEKTVFSVRSRRWAEMPFGVAVFFAAAQLADFVLHLVQIGTRVPAVWLAFVLNAALCTAVVFAVSFSVFWALLGDFRGFVRAGLKALLHRR